MRLDERRLQSFGSQTHNKHDHEAAHLRERRSASPRAELGTTRQASATLATRHVRSASLALRWMALAFAAAVALGGPLYGCTSQHADQADVAPVDAPTADGADQLVFDESQAKPAEMKQETVRVRADASGVPEEVTVLAVLKRLNDAAFVLDQSNLTGIVNTEGNERYSQDGTTLLWESKGKDIAYEGSSLQKPPVGVSITYYLDGSEVTSEEIAGKSGSVTMRFDYRQPTDTQQPVYVFTTMLQLDHAHFSDVKVINGVSSSMGDAELVTGYAIPALRGATGLAGLKGSEDLGVPEYLEVQAQATEFQLDYTTTLVTTGLFEGVSKEKLEEGHDLIGAVQELESSSDKVLDGLVALSQGAGVYDDALKRYTDGARELDEGTQSLAAGIASLSSGGRDLSAGAHRLSQGLASLNKKLNEVDTKTLQDSDEQLQAIMPVLRDVIDQMNASDYATLEQRLADISDYFETVVDRNATIAQLVNASIDDLIQVQSDLAAMRSALDELKSAGVDTEALEEPFDRVAQKVDDAIDALTYVEDSQLDFDLDAMRKTIQDQRALLRSLNELAELLEPWSDQEEFERLVSQIEDVRRAVSQLSDGAAQLDEGMGSYARAIATLGGGAEELRQGADLLSSGGGELYQGYGTLAQGIASLLSGYRVFDDEGIRKLSELGSAENANVLVQMQRLKDLEGRPQSFSGHAEGTATDVKYIIETSSVTG